MGLFMYHLSLPGNKSVKTFPRQRRIVGGVVLCSGHMASKESGLLVFPRTSCLEKDKIL
jgi:hypothetical protein